MKTLNFYIQFAIILAGIMNPFSLWMLFSVIIIAYWFMYRNLSPDEIYNITGAKWIANKCKNYSINKITNELMEE